MKVEECIMHYVTLSSLSDILLKQETMLQWVLDKNC